MNVRRAGHQGSYENTLSAWYYRLAAIRLRVPDEIPLCRTGSFAFWYVQASSTILPQRSHSPTWTLSITSTIATHAPQSQIKVVDAQCRQLDMSLLLL